MIKSYWYMNFLDELCFCICLSWLWFYFIPQFLADIQKPVKQETETSLTQNTESSSMQLNTSDNLNNNNPTTPSTSSASNPSNMSAPSGRQPVKRRARRRATSQSQDPAEQLTEMSVRGLNLFRYASINEGIYQCTECAKVDVQKTFKNKYSFQRHAFLYHEGHQRKVFPCPVCQKEFSRPDKMKNHMKTVHDCFMPKDCVFPMGFFLQQWEWRTYWASLLVNCYRWQLSICYIYERIDFVLGAIS